MGRLRLGNRPVVERPNFKYLPFMRGDRCRVKSRGIPGVANSAGRTGTIGGMCNHNLQDGWSSWYVRLDGDQYEYVCMNTWLEGE